LLFFLSCCCFVYNFNLLFLLFSYFTPFYVGGFQLPSFPWLFVLALLLLLLLLVGRFNLARSGQKPNPPCQHTIPPPPAVTNTCRQLFGLDAPSKVASGSY